MTELITGGSASGKSAYAELQAVSCPAVRRIYVAAMIPVDAESEARIARHRAMRAKKRFETVECYTGLESLTIPAVRGIGPEDTVILLECMSNLAANEQYLSGEPAADIRRRIRTGIRHLQKSAGHIIIVTNEVFSDGVLYGEDTEAYLELLGGISRDLAELADTVTEVVYGIPVRIR